ncbi:V-type proton ATPase subunit S1 [Drosophila grimshawi]|uniref:GH11675 n=1 Tax=Drosophila grimshawi TaxID=7222 RepID=B4JCP8_DROGR|nr:V-type proton ATPase subunit S1 [Drosophila grimshawi]EDW04212.1 GH11675 [Drosophila grimshawi]
MAAVQLLLLINGIAAIHLPSTPPAVIWGVKLPGPGNIFQALPSRKFVRMLMPQQEDHMIVAFLAPMLTSKDLSCGENDKCFEYLRQVAPLTYYSQVQQPVESIEQLFTNRGQKLKWSTTFEMSQLKCQTDRIHAYNFRDNNLTAHDQIMAAVAGNLWGCPLIMIYTAHGEQMEALQRRLQRTNSIIIWEKQQPSWKKAKRNKLLQNRTKIDPNEVTVLRHLKAIIGVNRIVLAEQYLSAQQVHYKRQQIDLNEKHSSLRLELEHRSSIMKGVTLIIVTSMGSLRLRFLPAMGNWHMTSMKFKNITLIPRDIIFYSNKFSFCCQALTAYSKEGHRLTLFSFSMDIIIEGDFSALDYDYIPKPCWLCEGYLTTGLIQSIFIVVILLSLLGMGLTMFLSMGRNKRMSGANDPEPHVKETAET